MQPLCSPPCSHFTCLYKGPTFPLYKFKAILPLSLSISFLINLFLSNSQLSVPVESSVSTGSITMGNVAAFLFLLLLSSGGNLIAVNGQRTWCVAKPSSDQATLLANINYACSQVDCRILQRGCPCFFPDNLINHASIAMNLYYHLRGRNHWNCDFRASGLIVVTDPSYGNCIYP